MRELVDRVKGVLSATPPHWTALCQGLSGDVLERPAAPGEWSALACLQHLVDTERDVFPVRLEALLEGRDFAAYDPDAAGGVQVGTLAAAELAEQFAALRSASLARLAVVGERDLARTALHAELGRVTLAEMLNEWAAHDLNHTIQAERAVMQPFLAASGPWRHYFADHDAELALRR